MFTWTRRGLTQTLHPRDWVDETGRGGWKRPSGKGQHLIILHAGWEGGWIDSSALVFRSKKRKSADYHDDMNAKHFLEWFEKQLLTNVPDSSVIVLDNAPYHNTVVHKCPRNRAPKVPCASG